MHYARWRRLKDEDKGAGPLDKIEVISNDPNPNPSPGRPPTPVGTRKVYSDGYVYVKVRVEHMQARPDRPSGTWILEHRKVMAEHLGRPLETNERVIHKDGNFENNTLDNLELKWSNGSTP